MSDSGVPVEKLQFSTATVVGIIAFVVTAAAVCIRFEWQLKDIRTEVTLLRGQKVAAEDLLSRALDVIERNEDRRVLGPSRTPFGSRRTVSTGSSTEASAP